MSRVGKGREDALRLRQVGLIVGSSVGGPTPRRVARVPARTPHAPKTSHDGEKDAGTVENSEGAADVASAASLGAQSPGSRLSHDPNSSRNSTPMDDCIRTASMRSRYNMARQNNTARQTYGVRMRHREAVRQPRNGRR